MKSKKPKYRIDNKKLTRLVDKARKGDEHALEQLVTESSRYIFYYSLMMLQSADKAQDAVQDVLLTLLRKIDTIENSAVFLSWLKIVTANYCKNKLSRERENYSLDESYEYVVDDSEQVDPARKLESDEFRSVMLEAVNNLPPSQRESVMMYYYEQLTTREIAEALSVSENTVKSRLRYARNGIRERLEKYGKNNLMLGAPPMSLISYVLISEAEKQPCLVLPDTALRHEIFISAVKASVCGARIPIKAAALFCSAVVAVSGVTAFAVSGMSNYGNGNISQSRDVSEGKSAETRSTPKPSAKKYAAAETKKQSQVFSEASDFIQETEPTEETGGAVEREEALPRESSVPATESVRENTESEMLTEPTVESSVSETAETPSAETVESTGSETAETESDEPETTQPEDVVPSLNKTRIVLKAGESFLFEMNGGEVKSVKPSDRKVVRMNGNELTALTKGVATVKFLLSDGTMLTARVAVKTNPKLGAKTVTVKKGRTATVKIIGKAKGVGITLKNTKYAKMVYNKKLSAVTVKGLKKGNTTLTITVNGKELQLKTKVK